MAARKPLFQTTEGFSEEMATSDSATFGALTLGGNIDMNSAGKVVNSNDASASGDLLVYGQSSWSLAAGAFTGEVAMGSSKITGLANGVASGDAVNKGQLDTAVAGLKWKESVRAKAQGNINLAAPGATIDGVTMSAGDRFAAFAQTTTTQDGIYEWTGAASAATRVSDAAAASSFASCAFFVEEGTVDADKGYVCTDDEGSAVLGTDDLTIVNFTGAGSLPDATAGSGGATKGKVTFDSDKGLGVTAGVAEAKIDAVTIDFNGGGSMAVTGVPSLFEVGGTAVGANVTAANLDTLTGAGGTTLHSHSHANATGQGANDHHNQAHQLDGSDHTVSGLTTGHVMTATGATTFAFQAPGPASEAPKVENSLTTATDATANGDPVYVNGSATLGKSLATDDAKARVTGLIRTGGGAAPASVEVVSHGICTGVLSSATPGTPYYLQAAGGIGTTVPAGGNRVIQIGKAWTADDLWVQIIDYGKKAA